MIKHTIAATIALIAISGTANAQSMKCERYQVDNNAFTSTAAADSWFPKTRWINTNDFDSVPRSTRKVMKHSGYNNQHASDIYLKSTLFSNGKMIVEFAAKSGYKQPSPARYRCK